MSGPGPASPAPPARSRLSRAASGCVLGCAGLILLAGVAAVTLVRWGARPMALPSPAALLTPATRAFAVVTADLEDPRTADFVAALLEAEGDDDAGFLRKAFPVRWAGALVAGDVAVTTFSLGRFANLLKLSLLPARFGAGDAHSRLYRDQVILRDRGEPWSFSLVGPSLVFASAESGAEYAVDRLLDGDGGTPSAALAPLWAPEGQEPLRGLASNAEGEIVTVLTRFVTEVLDGRITDAPGLEALGRARAARLAGALGVPLRSSLSGTVELFYDGPVVDEVAALARLGPDLAAALAGHGIEGAARVVAGDGVVTVEFELAHLAEALAGSELKFGSVEMK